MCIWFMFYLCREKNKTLFWANKALFYRLRKRNANRNIKKTASSRNFWICREYAFCLRIWSRLCMRMRRPVQDGLYCESLWNPAKVYLYLGWWLMTTKWLITVMFFFLNMFQRAFSTLPMLIGYYRGLYTSLIIGNCTVYSSYSGDTYRDPGINQQ